VFSAFGSTVTMIGRSDRHAQPRGRRRDLRALHRPAGRARIDLRLQRDAVGITCATRRSPCTTRGRDGSVEEVESDLLLVATGRHAPTATPSTWQRRGSPSTPAGFVIVVDDQQRTSVPGVWALGDVSSPWMLKHVANHEARIVAHNLLDPSIRPATIVARCRTRCSGTRRSPRSA
jgi:mycothione reductase